MTSTLNVFVAYKMGLSLLFKVITRLRRKGGVMSTNADIFQLPGILQMRRFEFDTITCSLFGIDITMYVCFSDNR